MTDDDQSTRPDDDEPVIFGYAASCNISFRGQEDSGYTRGQWREMTEIERQEAYEEFLYDNLGVEIFLVADEDVEI
jgi:hypothetical protein